MHILQGFPKKLLPFVLHNNYSLLQIISYTLNLLVVHYGYFRVKEPIYSLRQPWYKIMHATVTYQDIFWHEGDFFEVNGQGCLCLIFHWVDISI